ncbi:hypothetical protein [Brevibacillus reuszeri]|uniref:hypothetical protein n=1 Tax=Brevibacillus reuszeri TaxID=54915 RepID=UPI003D1D9054
MRNDDLIKKLEILIQMHEKGLLGGEVMPEDALIGTVPEQEWPNVLTLGMSLNYQRNSYTLWKMVAQCYLDEGSRWVFDPQKVAESSLDDLRDALLQHRVALQPTRHPEIWHRVSRGITGSSPKGNVLGLIESADYDIAQLQTIMQVQRKADFPYLSGPKLFHYWLYVMESYAGISWKSRELITIAPDTHILQATVKLGLCLPEVLHGTAKDREAVASAWERALSGSRFAPIDVHTPLWLWSRADFPPLPAKGND